MVHPHSIDDEEGMMSRTRIFKQEEKQMRRVWTCTGLNVDPKIEEQKKREA